MCFRLHFAAAFIFLFSLSVFSEGSKELRPDSTVSSADLVFCHGYQNGDTYPDFGIMGCAPNYRLYIHIKNAGECILFGLNINSGRHYNLRKPDGTIALTGALPLWSFPGYIKYFKQCQKGPFPSIGGYTPLQYQVTNPADTGNYYFELYDLPSNYYIGAELWDFQVVSGAHTPALPSDTINGRVWSQSWEFEAYLAYNQRFNAPMYVLSDDGIVTKLQFTNARIGIMAIFCNPSGCYNTGNPLIDRQSQATNTWPSFPGIAQYKVFINNPDSSVYPSGSFGMITSDPSLITDPLFPPCSPEKLIVVNVNKPGTAEIGLTFPYGSPATDVTLSATLVAGTTYVPWNGLDGTGSLVPEGTVFNIRVIYMNGLTNLPIWDQEQNPAGYKITLVRPVDPAYQTPVVFWDDSNISGSYCPSTTNLTGCISFPAGCHIWSGTDCHDNMINTWWYGKSDTAMADVLFTRQPPSAIGHDTSRCGPGSVILHATVQPDETVDWYDSPAGGTLLLAGDTSFVTPFLNISTTYYAETKNDSSGCTSPVRTPVHAFILNIAAPTLSGPQAICKYAHTSIYSTEPGMQNYQWTVSPGGIINGDPGSNTIMVDWTTPGLQQVTVNYDLPAGCPGERPALLYVMVGTKPDSAGAISGLQEVCSGTTGVLYSVAPVAFATRYTWTVPPGVVMISGSGTDSIIVDFPPSATSGYFKVFASDTCGDGPASPPYPVMVFQPPVAFAGPGDTICKNGSFTVEGAVASNFSGIKWIHNGYGYLTDDTTLSPVYYPSHGDQGDVVLTLIAYGYVNCNNDSSDLTLHLVPSSSVSAGNDGQICEGSPFRVNGATANGYSAINWRSSGSGYFDDPHLINPVYFPGTSDVNNGSVWLTIDAIPFAPCEKLSDSIQVIIEKAPSGDAGPGTFSCQDLYITLNDASATGYSSISWTHDGLGTLTGEHTLVPEYYPAAGENGIITFTMTVAGKNACSDSSVQSQTRLLIYPAVVADAGVDTIIKYGTATSLSGIALGGSGSLIYRWEPVSMVEDSTGLIVRTVKLLANTSFLFTVTDSVTGCSASDSVKIIVKKHSIYDPGPSPYPGNVPEPGTITKPECLVIYNVITPNGNGVNDAWIIDCIENYPENKVEIYNRWGDLIISFSHYDNVARVWRGTTKDGQPVPDGTYFYVVSIRDTKPIQGWVQVMSNSR